MPVRGTFKNFLSAAKAPFAKRFGLLSNVDFIDKDYDNNYSISWSTADGATSIPGLKVDESNRLVQAYNVKLSSPKVIRFNMNANASLADQCMWISDGTYEVLGAFEVHAVAGNDAAAVTLNITKDTSGVVPGAGVNVLSSTFDMKATANTVQTLGPSTTPSAISIVAGDRLSLNFTGTLTTLSGVVVELRLAPGYSGGTAVFAMNANTGLADQCFYTATKNMRVSRIDYVHSTAGTNGSAVNVQVTKDTSTTAPGAGTDLLTNNTNAGFDCKGTINVVQNGALTATAADLRLAPGDRLSVDFSGTLTALAGVLIVVTFSPYYNSLEFSFNLNANASLADQCIFIANRTYKVLFVSEVHAVAGNDGGAVNLQLTLDTGTAAPGAGTDLLSNNANAGFDLKGTANTVQVGTFVSQGGLYMFSGDRLSLDFAGVLTTLSGLEVTITLEEA